MNSSTTCLDGEIPRYAEALDRLGQWFTLDLDDLVYVAARSGLSPAEVRGHGLEAAVARPRTTVFGQDAIHPLFDKAAALVHSVARNHALVDRNKRLALGALVAFLV